METNLQKLDLTIGFSASATSLFPYFNGTYKSKSQCACGYSLGKTRTLITIDSVFRSANVVCEIANPLSAYNVQIFHHPLENKPGKKKRYSVKRKRTTKGCELHIYTSEETTPKDWVLVYGETLRAISTEKAYLSNTPVFLDFAGYTGSW